MSEPIWVPVEAVHIIHDRQIARHGGASGLRDEGLLRNALQRPVKKWQNEDVDVIKANRMVSDLGDVQKKVFTRHLFGAD